MFRFFIFLFDLDITTTLIQQLTNCVKLYNLLNVLKRFDYNNCYPKFLCFFSVRHFVGSAWSFGFFIPTTTANDLRLRRIFYPRFYPLHYFLILILEKEPVFPFSMLSAKQGNYGYHFYNVFGMTRSLTGD